MKIFKYGLEITDSQTIQLPGGAKPLSVAVQHGRVCLWALVDPAVPTGPREFIIHGTGHSADDVADATFIGSVLLNEGALVFHVFEAAAKLDA